MALFLIFDLLQTRCSVDVLKGHNVFLLLTVSLPNTLKGHVVCKMLSHVSLKCLLEASANIDIPHPVR